MSNKPDPELYKELFARAREFHGHVCPGIVLGTRLTMAGLRELGMDPMKKNRNLLVYIEIDRCGADAVQAITGCSLGHRTLKHKDYGKFAATFVDLTHGNAVRVAVDEKNRAEHDRLEKDEILKVLSECPEDEILKVEKVTIVVPSDDIPGFPRGQTVCSRCGERIMDHREVMVGGEEVCRNCANGSYYQRIEPLPIRLPGE